MNDEVELKLELERQDLPLLTGHPMLRDAPSRRDRQLTVYYDTAKGKVRKAGYSLRVRSSKGAFVQTIKPLNGGAGMFARREWEQVVGSIEPDLAALAETPLAGFAEQDGKLVPAVQSEVERTVWRIERETACIEVALDVGSIAAGESEQELTELELELLRGDAESLTAAARELAETVPVRVGVLSKADRGFAIAEGSLERATKAAPVEVTLEMSVAEGFAAIVDSCLKHFRLNEPLVVSRRDPAALHQARVAMRRLRSAFSLFRPAIADLDYAVLREELRWFTGQLGDARNLDVYLQRDLPADEASRITERREDAYALMIDTLGTQRFRRLMLELVAWPATGRWREGKKASKPLRPFAGRRLDRLWSRIVMVGDNIAAMDDEARHELRIDIKKLRYAHEFFRALYGSGKDHKRFGEAAEELQETLGHLNDIVTARALTLETVSADGHMDPPPSDDSERQHIEDAQRWMRKLGAAGPYWREGAPAVAMLWT